MTKAVLVTGVGAIIGYGVLRSLRASGQDLRLIGADIYEDAVGCFWADHFEQAPLTSSKAYFPWLCDVIAKNQIDLIIPGIEQDLYFLSEHRNELQSLSVTVVLNEPRLIGLSRDKWLMYKELELLRSSVTIESHASGDFHSLAEKLGLPFLFKPRCGYASKGIVRVNCESEFIAVEHMIGDTLIAQAIIGDDNEEYTVGAFGDGTGKVCASISLKRKLAIDGSTSKARVIHDDALDTCVAQLFEYFKPIGPTNLQFRKCQDGWKLLEINPRVSSSTSIRTAFGYNESEMCLRFFLDGESIQQPELRDGFAVRYIDEKVTYDRNHF